MKKRQSTIYVRIYSQKQLATLSRRDFLKLLAASGLGMTFAMTGLDRMVSLGGNKSNSDSRSTGFFREAFAQSAGSWTLNPSSYNTNITAIHAGLARTGKIIIVAGSSFNKDDFSTNYAASVYDPANGNETNLPNMTDDLFCCHQTQLPDGNILFAGGTLFYDEDLANNCTTKWRGSTKAYRFNSTPGVEAMQTRASMARGRWYPTLISLSDGKVAAFAGFDDYSDVNQLVEIYDPVQNSWTIKYAQGATSQYQPGASCLGNGPTYGGPGVGGVAPINLGNYPRMHLMPNGLVVTSGMSTAVRTWNPSTGVWLQPVASSVNRFYGASILLPLENVPAERGKILIAGGADDADNPLDSAQIIYYNTSGNLQVRTVDSMTDGRWYASQTILPTGQCLITGGTAIDQNSGYVFSSEMFDPVNELWSTWATATVPRTYHSLALLLPDGRVWTAGGTPSSNGNGEKRTEVFSPWYMSAQRPTINNVTSVSSSYGDAGGTITLSIPSGQGHDTDGHGVSLIKLGAATHHFEPNGRLIWLQDVSSTSNSLTVKMPLNGNFAPPGYYMIHILNQGVPSQAKIIQIPGSAPTDQGTPTITIISPSAKQIMTGPSGNVPISVVGSASDAGSGVQIVEVKLGSSGTWLAATNTSGNWSSWTRSLTATTAGADTIQARATDPSGNSSTITIPVTISFV